MANTNVKILVIEDELTVNKNIVRLLKAEKYTPLSAEDGEKGVEMALEENPDLIISDIMMPKLDGYGVLEKLQENPKTKLIPFIFLTALGERTDLRKGMQLGADDYIVKPFTADELFTAIKVKLRKKELAEQKIKEIAQKLDNINKFMETKEGMMENFNQEMRQPLTNIKLAIDMLQKDINPEQKNHYLQILRQEFERQINIINQSSELKKILTPENIHLLSNFHLLKF